VVLETDGTFSVIRRWQGPSRSALIDVSGFPGKKISSRKNSSGDDRNR
jgi:hypothetical protein